ncbi:formyltetrahydrofolate deformylase [Prochlorococcus marinus XMU1403]|uniref:formyltetrahydrofolate deformylase n=1 Tax=Prochlorococcus marinus TaxID=1219 RepID=UPI000D9BD292|nr:formyltetrahydrofolate deformylase [Prochlorococcus marinus]MBW3050361.1 formyltetrahydrofolate deformylase [Prochlorococcus marinus str. MU1403]PYE00542.1 formyltetrahydrofolate deformylase [Prochlorococcus marinus XMU1403]
MNIKTVILQFICPDKPGLVSDLASWIASKNGNIRHADHHTDADAKLFLSRIEWDLDGFLLDKNEITSEVNLLEQRLNGKAVLSFSDDFPNVAIFVSKQSHCLVDLLWRVKAGELRMNVPLVISNHSDLEEICSSFSIPFKLIEVNKNNKAESESKILDLLHEYNIDLGVLAKYMQILSSSFLEQFPNLINIHHSFLPAFKGAQPYHQAWDRGVKLIGATAHYVTKDLDAGPIIEQTISNVSHRDEVSDLIRKGRDLERVALARALRLHLKRQVIVYRGRTAVFT